LPRAKESRRTCLDSAGDPRCMAPLRISTMRLHLFLSIGSTPRICSKRRSSTSRLMVRRRGSAISGLVERLIRECSASWLRGTTRTGLIFHSTALPGALQPRAQRQPLWHSRLQPKPSTRHPSTVRPRRSGQPQPCGSQRPYLNLDSHCMQGYRSLRQYATAARSRLSSLELRRSRRNSSIRAQHGSRQHPSLTSPNDPRGADNPPWIQLGAADVHTPEGSPRCGVVPCVHR
jgi:hypothetical protein